MSFCRFGDDSDVYVYQSADAHRRGYYVCCACRLGPGDDESGWDDWRTRRRSEMEAHLREHEARGHKVPSKAFARLADSPEKLWKERGR